MKILVTGSTGTVGSEVVKALCDRQVDMRAFVRDESRARHLPPAAELFPGNLLDPEAVEQALDGVDKVYLLNGVVADELTQGLIVANLAQRLGISHLVYHSVMAAERFPDVPHFASKHAIEDMLKQSGLPCTILRPAYFFQNDAALKEPLTVAGIYPMPLGRTGIAAVDVRDIAAVAAIALTTAGHVGKSYNLAAAQTLSGPEAASLWSRLLGREVRYPGEDFAAYEQQMRQVMPSWAAFDLRMMLQRYHERGFVASSADVSQLTGLLGRPPRSYADFARATADSWR